MHRLVDSFRLGFLSDRIVEALSKYRENGTRISQDAKAVLSEGAFFIDQVLNGRKQITTGIYEKNALESIMIYNKSVSIVLDMPDIPAEINAEKIEKIFVDLKDSLVRMSRGEKVPSDKFEIAKSFFNYLREKTLTDSTTIMNGLYESRRSGRWELTLET